MARKRSNAKPKTHRALWAACALMAVLLVSDLASFFQIASAWAASAGGVYDHDRLLLGIDALVNLLCIALEAACIARAAAVVKLHDQDTHDHVAASQLFVIALVGVAVVEWSVASMVEDGFETAGFLVLLASLVPCFVYYAAVGRESHSPFWNGIRNSEPGEEPIDAGGLPKALVLDQDTGMLVDARTIPATAETPAAEAGPAGTVGSGSADALADGTPDAPGLGVPDPEAAAVRAAAVSAPADATPPAAGDARASRSPVAATVCTSAEFAAAYGDVSATPRSQRSLQNARRTAVYPLGDAVTGTLYLPEEKLAMTGPALGGEAHLGFFLQKDALTLVADDEPTRRLVAWYLQNQYLSKRHPGEALIELQELLIGDDPEALASLDDRIDRLEDSLSEGVNEVPRDFSDYVNDTRHDLGVLQKFYHQLAEAAEDALADGVLVDKRTKHLLKGLNRRASTLAGDASELRDYLNQVREGYQERVNVRQNGIMSILTIVTALATPVALLTGWYGMNFQNMPELQAPGAYNVVIIVAVTVVTLEVLFFKRRRWF